MAGIPGKLIKCQDPHKPAARHACFILAPALKCICHQTLLSYVRAAYYGDRSDPLLAKMALNILGAISL